MPSTNKTDILQNPFRALLDGDHTPLGTWLMAASANTAEAMGRAGFNWLLVDQEHAALDQMNTQHVLRAIGCTSAAPVVRLAASEPVLFKRALDQGAQTVMVPFIDTAEQARAAVGNALYPPAGKRGFAAIHRASGYGTAEEYARRANDSVFVIIQLETPAAIEALEDIAAVPGVDALFLGPGDLSCNMGHAGNIMHPDVQAAIRNVAERCRAIGKPCGIVGPTPEAVGNFVQMGYSFVAIASDLAMMMRQANAFIEALQPNLANKFESTVY